ncbi:ankyrin repeat domain-containing protein [Wolbachia endosymbiont of Protocalliphora sialia]
MLYSKEDIRELCLDADSFLINDNRYNNKITLESLQNRLRRKAKFKDIDLQSKCEGNNSLGDLLLKLAYKNDYLRVREFFLKNGFKPPEQEQVTADENKEKEEQNTPNVEEDRAELSNKNEDDQFSMSYNKIRKIVTNNSNITAEEFSNELKKEKIDIKITNQDGWTLLYYAVRSEGPYITEDRSIFLKTVKLLTNLNIGIDFKDTASKTVLGTAAINKQADVIKILLDSGKFNEEEKFNALRLAIIQGNVQEVEAFLSYVNDKSRQAALELAINNEIIKVLLNFIKPETPNVKENRAKPCSSNGNVGNRSVATAPPVSTNGNNNKNEAPVSTRTGPTVTPNNDKKANGFVEAQFSPPHEKETKYKKNKESFYTSLRSDVVGVVIAGLFVAAAVTVPSLAGALVCSVLAILVVMATGLHVKNFTLPSYSEMRENKVEPVNSSLRNHAI